MILLLLLLSLLLLFLFLFLLPLLSVLSQKEIMRILYTVFSLYACQYHVYCNVAVPTYFSWSGQ